MRIAMVGLGAIARKAYLPVLAPRADLQLVLCTRDPRALAEASAAWRIPDCASDVAQVVERGVDAAFVHTATESHAHVVATLLDAGIPVYVDKPIAHDLATARSVAERAERAGTLLMVGFNRRFAPMVRRVQAAGPARLVLMQKNRVALPDAVRRVVFDDFIHVVDTLRFLAPGDVAPVRASAVVDAGLLRHLVLEMGGAGFSAVGVMDRDGGTTEEVLEVTVPGEKLVVRDLDALVRYRAGEERRERHGDWESVLHRRGFPAIVQHFLDCAAGRAEPLQSARDALETHAVCEWSVARIEAEAARS